MKQLSKQSDKDLSKIFFNSVEEMNECYGIEAELPSKLYSNTDLVCYEIVEPFVYEYLWQYAFTERGFNYLDNLGEPVLHNHHVQTIESGFYEKDRLLYKRCCFVYVRVNEHLRKHLEENLLGCEFVSKNTKTYYANRRFTKRVDVCLGKLAVLDQIGFSTPLDSILLYPDDHSDPIPYKEWIKQINKQDVEVEN